MHSRSPSIDRFPRPLSVRLAAIAMIAGAVGTAHAQQVDIPAWRLGTEYRAMKLQRELAADMRQDQSLLLGSHNSFNSGAYGEAIYPNSQHSYTLWEQLDLGLRAIDMDVHASVVYPNQLWLSHTTCAGGNISSAQNTVWDGLYEIRQWLNNNPDEVITINFEQHFPMSYPSNWHAMLQVWVNDILGGGDPGHGPDVLIRPSDIAAHGGATDADAIARTATRMTMNELRGFGRVLIVNTGGVTSPCDDHYWGDYPTQDFMLSDVPSVPYCGYNNWYTFHARDFASDTAWHYWGATPVGTQVRPSCTSTSTYSVLYNNTSAGQYATYGSESPAVVREAVRAGMDYVRFDPVGKSLGLPGNPIEFPADEQMRATIWSWDHRYPPPVDGQPRAAMAVIQGDTARIRWADPNTEMRYAIQSPNGNWSISSERGNFQSAPPEENFSSNFRVPGNGFEMQNLFGDMVRAGITQVWINYHDLDGDGVWTHTTQNRTFPSSGLLRSPVPSLVSSGLSLSLALLEWELHDAPQTGRVMGVLPGSYGGSFVLSGPGTIVPAEHGHPVAIGRP